MSLPNSFYNVTDSIEDNSIIVTRTSLQDLTKTFQAHTNLESSSQSTLASSNVLMKYDRDRYSIVLPENTRSVKIVDKEVREWIGAIVITQSAQYGSAVPRKNDFIELTEQEATALCLQNRIVGRGLEMYGLTSNTKSIKKTLKDYLKKTNTPGKIEYVDSKYKLTLPINFAVTTQLLSTLKGKTLKEEVDVKHVICEPLTKTYRVILQANATLTYKISIPPSYYDTPVSLLNAIDKGLRYDAVFVHNKWSKRCTVNFK